MKISGIGTGIHYPVPLHLQKAYGSLNYSVGDFPVAEGVSGEIVSLPMFPQLTAAHQAKVAEEILSFNGKTDRKQTDKNQVATTSAILTV